MSELANVPLYTKLGQAKTNPNGCFAYAFFAKVGGGYETLPISWTNFVKPLQEQITQLSESVGSDFTYRFLNRSANFTQNIEVSEKILTIDVRYLSGSPVLSIGFTPSGIDILESSEVLPNTDGQDFNIIIQRSYNSAKTLYFTLTGGNASIVLKTSKNLFG